MEVLFVCRANIGRSQMAEAIFNKHSKHKSKSAGTKLILNEELSIKEITKEIPPAKFVIDCMKDECIDVSNCRIKQITQKMVEEFDKIIVMAEPETIPDFLKSSNKFIYWEIEDPKGKDLEGHKECLNQIKIKVKQFIKENNL